MLTGSAVLNVIGAALAAGAAMPNVVAVRIMGAIIRPDRFNAVIRFPSLDYSYKVSSNYRLKDFMKMSQDRELFIGTVSGLTGLKVETIRYYENAGVIPPPKRGSNRYRVYSREHVERLLFVKRCRELGFSLEHTGSLLDLADAENRMCRQVSQIAENRLNEVRAKIADLRRMETVLEEFTAACPRDSSPDCPIITALADTTGPQDRKPPKRRRTARGGARSSRSL